MLGEFKGRITGPKKSSDVAAIFLIEDVVRQRVACNPPPPHWCGYSRLAEADHS